LAGSVEWLAATSADSANATAADSSERPGFVTPEVASPELGVNLLSADRRDRTPAESAARRIALNFAQTVETNAESS
jgi:hypothetical protein